LAKVHRKTENTIQSYHFSVKIAADLSFIRLFTAVSQFLVEIHHLAHGGDIPFELPAVEGCTLADHPIEFLKFQAECVVVNLSLLIPLSTPVNRGYGVSQGVSTIIGYSML
jgi:hypothetical protein